MGRDLGPRYRLLQRHQPERHRSEPDRCDRLRQVRSHPLRHARQLRADAGLHGACCRQRQLDGGRRRDGVHQECRGWSDAVRWSRGTGRDQLRRPGRGEERRPVVPRHRDQPRLPVALRDQRGARRGRFVHVRGQRPGCSHGGERHHGYRDERAEPAGRPGRHGPGALHLVTL